MDEDALLAWLGGKSYGRLKHRKHKKLQDRADDDNGNDDKSSADYIPMESVSREYVKVKNRKDKKELDGRISASIDSNNLKKELEKNPPRSEAKDEKRGAKDQSRVPETQSEPAKKGDKKEVPKVKLKQPAEEKQSKVYPVEPETTNSVPTAAPVLPSTTPQQGILPPTTPQPIETPTADKDLITEQVVADNEKLGDNAQQANPLSDPQSRAPTARSIPSLVGQLPPTETQPIADIPGGNGELKGIELDDRSNPKSLPLQLDIPADTGELQKPADPVLADLSAEYRRATSKPISLFGQPIDPASNAYDAADRAIAPMQLLNEGLLKAPTGLARLSNFINYPLDKLTGYDAFGKNNKMLDKADQFIDSFGVTRAPTNAAERAFTALGMLAVPNPATMLSPVAGSVGVGLNEGVYQVAEAVKRRLNTDPPVQNKYDELEPRVTSVDAATAKQIQKKVDLDKESFTRMFAEANYTDALLYTGGALAALAGLYKGAKFLKSPVAGRTILNPEKPIVEELPQSITTSKEVLRTINQDANYVLENQARKFNDLDLVHDISTSTRAGLASRVENMVESGSVNAPGFSTQLSASPKQLVEFHLQRPQQEQQDISRAFHLLDQADSAKLSAEKRAATKASEDGKIAKPLEAQPDYVAMPPEPDIRWAEQLLAKPENAGVVRMMKEIREAKANVAKASGRWDEETTANMLLKRPNYVHRIETPDSKIVDGKVVPKTRIEAMIDGLKSKQGQAGFINDGNAELSSVLERSRVNAPNQMLDAVLANVDDLQKTVVFAHENDIVKRFHNGLKDHPEFSTAVKELKDGDKVPTGFDTVTYYDNGKQVRFAIEPLTARALKFAPTSAASRYNLAATIRNAFQQATTGPVLAPFFAPTSFAMEASIGAATRSRSLRVGNIDAALQAATGGKLAAPGDMFGSMAAGVGAVRRAQRADRILHATQKTEEYLLKYGNRSLQDLEAQMPGTTKKLARGLAVGQDTTLENILHQNRTLYEQTAKGWALKNGALHASQNELMRNANKFYSDDVVKAFSQHLGHEEGSAWWNYWKGLVVNIHDANRLALVEKNMGRVGDKQLAYEARKFSGDLGVRGAGNMESGYILSDDVSKAAQLATRVGTSKPVGSLLDAVYASVPYINPHIQGTARFLDQLAKQPTTVIAGAIASTTLPHIGSLGLSAALGPEYLDYLLNKREEYKKTGYIYIPIPGAKPEDGLDIRIDPVLSPFGYPAVEALDSLFGLRKMVAQFQQREAPNAEQQGIISALSDGIKEAIGFGMPIQASLALASQGVAASRNVFEPSYSVRSEQASKLGSGKNTGSALSVPMQLMLENVLGATAQHAIAGMDAYASSAKTDSALGNAAKGAASSFLSKMPAAGLIAKVPGASTLFAGKTYNETGTVLAANTRKFTDAARRIEAGIQATENILLKSSNAKMAGGNAVDPVRMGNAGNVQLPPEIQNNIDEVKGALVGNGRLKGINSERSAITTSLAGLRGVNAGNIGRHLLVPLKEGKEIGGLGYTILNEELVKKELAKEEDSRIHPRMTPKGKLSAQQRAEPLPHLIGGMPKIQRGKVTSPEGRFYKAPTLKEVQALRNALNERRYTLDLQASDEYEAIEQALGIKLVDSAKKIKLTNDVEAGLSDEPAD